MLKFFEYKTKSHAAQQVDKTKRSFPGIDNDDLIESVPNIKKPFALKWIEGGMQFKTANSNAYHQVKIN